jgi:ABC-type transport system substrate-binding protein
MRRTVLVLLAASSASALIGPPVSAPATQRPRYGGTLRVAIAASVSSLDLTSGLSPVEAAAVMHLRSLIFDRLVRLDERGTPQAAVATSWRHDSEHRRWSFSLRANLAAHDGAALTPEDVLDSFQGTFLSGQMRINGTSLEIDLQEPRPDLLLLLATDPAFVIGRVDPDELDRLPVGTGPFQLVEWQSGVRAVFRANDNYWDGRPYLDSIEVIMGRSSRDALTDLQLDRADLAELDPAEARRGELDGARVSASAPLDLIALEFDPLGPRVQDARLRQAISLAIDRGAIQKVILQGYGDAAGNLFPNWLTGYSFLFSVAPDLSRARALVAELPRSAAPLRIGYDPADALLRQIAERVAVNARDAGIVLEPRAAPGFTADTSVDLRVRRVRINGPVLNNAVAQAERALPFSTLGAIALEEVYRAEREFLGMYTIVPLAHAPELVGIDGRVKGWRPAPHGGWRLEDVWLDGGAP